MNTVINANQQLSVISNSLLIPKGFLNFDNLENARASAEIIAQAEELCPPAYRKNPIKIMMCIQRGLEIGLSPCQALENLFLVNGKWSMFAETMLALVKAKPDYEYCHETFDAEKMRATCILKRKGEQEHEEFFDKEKAEKAKLWGKPGVWVQYPERMLLARARGFAIRNVFPHHIRGIISFEEARDYPVTGRSAPVPVQAEVIEIEKEELISDEQLATLKQKIAEAKADEALFSKYCKIPCLEMMPATKFKHAAKKLDMKIEELKAQEKIVESTVAEDEEFWEDYDREEINMGTKE